MYRRLPALLLACLVAPAMAGGPGYVGVPGGSFRSAIRYEESGDARSVAAFALMERAVSNADFARFVERQPQWRRDRVPALFAGPGYLGHWESATGPGAAVAADAPVVQVSWYAADAYCRAQDARLPTFLEWEYAAAADAHRRDARGDQGWQALLLNDATARALDAGDAPPNAYGIHGLHGVAWEWVDDFATLMGDSDKRGADDGDKLKYCGATALAFNDRQHYGVMKRFALLSALQPVNTLGNLGFRCARSQP